MQLAIISPESEFKNEVNVVNSLLVNGLKLFHLRKKGLDKVGYLNYIDGIDKQYHSRIVVHDHFELFNELDLGGVHLSSHVREKENVADVIQSIPVSRISTSFHAWEEVIENTFPYRYVFISPVFDSISKGGYKANIDLEEVGEVQRACKARTGHIPAIFGLGGVGAVQLPILDRHGFDGAAVLGAVWEKADPVKAFISMMDVINSISAD